MRRRPRSLAETPPGYTISIKAQTARQSFMLLKTSGYSYAGVPTSLFDPSKGSVSCRPLFSFARDQRASQ